VRTREIKGIRTKRGDANPIEKNFVRGAREKYLLDAKTRSVGLLQDPLKRRGSLMSHRKSYLETSEKDPFFERRRPGKKSKRRKNYQHLRGGERGKTIFSSGIGDADNGKGKGALLLGGGSLRRNGEPVNYLGNYLPEAGKSRSAAKKRKER